MSSDPTTTRIDLDELVRHHDPKSKDTFLSAFADLTSGLWQRALDARRDEIRDSIGDEAAEEVRFDEAYDAIHAALTALAKKGAKGGAVIVSPVHGFEASYPLAAPLRDRLVLDSSPYVCPLAQYEDAYPPFLLVMLDGARGAIWRVEAGQADLEATKKMDLIGRHKKGGFSQMRYQRHRAGRLDRLFDELIERIQDIMKDEDIERIIVAGPGQAKDRLVERFPQDLKERLGAVEDVDLDDPRDDPEVTRFVRLARNLETKANEELVAGLKDELLSGGLATADAFAVARAARDGRVDTLLVLKGHTAGGRKCEEHQSFFAPGETCSCGTEGTEVDLLNEAVEHTLATDGAVEFVDGDQPFLERRGGIGAFLRW